MLKILVYVLACLVASGAGWVTGLYFPVLSFAQEGGREGETAPSVTERLKLGLPPNPDRIIVEQPESSILIITDTAKNHELIEKMLAEMDVGPTQVEIESKFIEIRSTDLDQLGVQWQGLVERQLSGPGIDKVWGTIDDQLEGGGILDRNIHRQYWSGQTKFPSRIPTTGAAFRFTKLNATEFRVVMNALNKIEKKNLISSPKVTTMNNQPANFQAVRVYPYVTAIAYQNQGTTTAPIWVETRTVEEKRIGVKLEVTPRILPNNVIELDIHPIVDELQRQVSILPGLVEQEVGWPIIEAREAQTTMLVQSGDTVVLGGLIRDVDTDSESGVPILSKVPILGNLFKARSKIRTKSNLLIFVTGRLITPSGEVLR